MTIKHRATVLVLVLAVLAALTALPVLAQEVPVDPPACPLSEGIVINALGGTWEIDFIRSDRGLAAATAGPGAATVPAGTYNVVLAAWDDHGPDDDTQLNEQWVLQGLDADGEVVYISGATPDIPDDQNLVIATVDTEVEISGFTQGAAVHAAFPNTESPNSVFPLCASFVPVQSDPGSITVKATAVDDPSTLWAFDLSSSSSTPVLGDGLDAFTWSELGAGAYELTETVLAGWQLDSVSCVSGEEGEAATTALTGGVSITLEQGEDVTCTFVNSKTTTPTTQPSPDPDPDPDPDPVEIGDLVWEDTDADGYQSDFEFGVAGVTVNLIGNNGLIVATAVTGSSGDYLVSGPAGTYTVQIVPPAGYELGPADGAGSVTLSQGQSDLTKDFGIFKTPEVLPQVVTTAPPAVTPETLPFTGVSTTGAGGVGFALVLAGGLVLLVGSSRRRHDIGHRMD